MYAARGTSGGGLELDGTEDDIDFRKQCSPARSAFKYSAASTPPPRCSRHVLVGTPRPREDAKSRWAETPRSPERDASENGVSASSPWELRQNLRCGQRRRVIPKTVDTYSALHSNGCARAQMKDNLGKLGVGDCAIIPRMIVSASSTTTSSPPTFKGRSKSLHVHDPRPADCPFNSSTPWPALSRNELRNIVIGRGTEQV